MKTPAAWLRSGSKFFSSSISNKIIIPYALLTAILAAFGVFVVTQLVAGSFEARLKNQLLEAGKVVSDEIVARERLRLEVERSVANTLGVPEALINRDVQKLNELVSPLIANNLDIDSIVIVDTQSKELLRLHRETLSPNAPVMTRQNSGADYTDWPAVRSVLADARGETKDTQFARDQNANDLIYTAGPIRTSDGIVGTVLVGTYLRKEVELLHSLALAELTLFDESAEVLVTTLPVSRGKAEDIFELFTPNRYQQVLDEREVTLLDDVDGPQDIETRSQTYRLGYAPFLLRGRVFGVYAVALPTDFVTQTNNQSRNRLVLIFSLGVGAVFGIGYVVSRRIIRPVIRLVETARAITAGDLSRRSGLKLGDEIGVLANTFDHMTAELQRLLKIQEEEASKLNAILTGIADGVIVLDQTGNIIRTNPAAEAILETLEDDFSFDQLQQVGVELEPTEDGALSSAQLLRALTGLEFHEKRRFEAGNRVLDALSAPVKVSDGAQLGSVVVLRDITREVEAEKLKDNFITSVSHELKTPLTAIKGYVDLLSMTAAGKLDENQIGFIKIIDENLGDLSNIIQQVLDLSQIEADELGIDRETLDLSELVEAEVEKWSEKMERKQLTLRAHLPAEPVWIEGDWNRLSQVIDNLLDNAYNYTLEGGIEIALKQENGRGQIDIMDTGVGTLKKDQPYIFTRFFRAIHDERTYEVSGAGLALFISKAIIEAHEGDMWFESEPHQGSTFSFALPIVDPDELDDIEEGSVEYV